MSSFATCRGYYTSPGGVIATSDIVSRGGVNLAKVLKFIFNRLPTVSNIGSSTVWGIYGTTSQAYYVNYTYNIINNEYAIDIYRTAGAVNVASITYLTFTNADAAQDSQIGAQCLNIASYE